MAWKDLTEFISSIQAEHSVLVCMDANCDVNDTTSPVGQLKNKCKLIDLIQERGSSYRDDPTYIRGTKRIDVILASKSIIDGVTRVQHSQYHDLTLSDHKAVIVDIHNDFIFNRQVTHATAPSTRTLDLKRPETICTYVEYLEEYCKYHKIADKIAASQTLISNPETHKEGIALFLKAQEGLTRGQRAAEKRCGRKKYGYA